MAIASVREPYRTVFWRSQNGGSCKVCVCQYEQVYCVDSISFDAIHYMNFFRC